MTLVMRQRKTLVCSNLNIHEYQWYVNVALLTSLPVFYLFCKTFKHVSRKVAFYSQYKTTSAARVDISELFLAAPVTKATPSKLASPKLLGKMVEKANEIFGLFKKTAKTDRARCTRAFNKVVNAVEDFALTKNHKMTFNTETKLNLNYGPTYMTDKYNDLEDSLQAEQKE